MKGVTVEIHSDETINNSGTNSDTGESWHTTKQTAYVNLPGKPYPVEIRFNLDDGQQPYPKGIYEFKPESLWISGNGKLNIKPRLTPADSKAAKAA